MPVAPVLPRIAVLAAALTALSALADPLSKKADVDFYREVPSRDLHGLATRSDGRLVAGPVLTDLSGRSPAPLLWSLEPLPGGTWLTAGGPGGQIAEITVNAAAGSVAAKPLIKLGDMQVYAAKPLPGGSILAGSSTGALFLVREGKVVARTGLPVDSVFDLLVLDGTCALAATGNPARIYRIDLVKFAAAGVSQDKISDAASLLARGVSLFGEVGDRNLRRIVRLADGRIAAGSAPKGNLYLFGKGGGAPYLAQENHDAEVTDILPDPSGGYYASVVFTSGNIHPLETNIPLQVPADAVTVVGSGGAPSPSPGPNPSPAAPIRLKENSVEVGLQPERFSGRSELLWFSAAGFPEVLANRTGVAFYRLARWGGLVVISGGEQGEMTGYDTQAHESLTFSGSASSQVNEIAPIAGQPGRFLALRNNAPGFAIVDFGGSAGRTATTRRIDLGAPARLGAVRFNRLRGVDIAGVSVAIRVTNGANEPDAWSPWIPMTEADGWRAQVPVGRYAELKVSLPAAAPAEAELDRASIYYITQNHRPELQDFRMLSPNFAIVVPPEPVGSVVTTVGQLIQSEGHDSEHRHSGFLSSQIVASPGTRVAFWTVNDVDGDNLTYTFSIRREGETNWTDIAVDSKDSYVQFDTLHLQEGTWFTRLVARETAPRPEAERLSVSFETDDMVVDHTPPDIEELTARKEPGKVVVTVRGKDALSLLDSAEFDFNNGLHETVEQPADGILDGKEETFVVEVPTDQAAGATSVEVTLYDAAGNGATRRIGL